MSEKEVSLRDQVEAAYEAIEEPENETPDVDSERHDEPTNKIDSKDDREPDVQKKEESGGSKDSETSIDESNIPEAPSNWAPEDVEAFNELDDRGKKLYLKRHKEREAAYTKKYQSLAEERKIAERFIKELEPYESEFQRLGVDKFDAFKRAATAHLRLLNETPQGKLALLQRMASDYGINLGAQPQNTQQEQQQYDPQILNLLQKVQTLEQSQQAIEHERIQREYSSLEGQIVSFQNAKDDKGEPKYPHFETLRLDMSNMLQKGMAKSLEDAYKKSLRLNDDLHQEYINMHTNNRIKEAETLKKTAASKKAGFNVKGTGGSSIKEAPSDNLSTRQIIEQAYAKQEKRQRI